MMVKKGRGGEEERNAFMSVIELKIGYRVGASTQSRVRARSGLQTNAESRHAYT